MVETPRSVDFSFLFFLSVLEGFHKQADPREDHGLHCHLSDSVSVVLQESASQH